MTLMNRRTKGTTISDMKKGLKTTFLSMFLFLLLLTPVYLDLGKENVNVDQLQWYRRTQVFTQGLKTGDFWLTYQQYHPGVTLMYLIMSGQTLFKLFTHTSYNYPYVPYSLFPMYNFITKFFVTSACVLLNILSAYFLSKLTKSKIIRFGFLILLFTEPYYVGLLRNLHMDALAASLIFSSGASFFDKYFTKAEGLTILPRTTLPLLNIFFLLMRNKIFALAK